MVPIGVDLGVAPQDFCPGDANNDSVVNFDDITEALANWGATCP